MPGRIIATVGAYAIDEETKNLLKIKGDFSFIALPNEILEKHKISAFDIIEDEKEIKLVAQTKEVEQTSESNKPSPTKMEVV